jgi:hypothetical protein
VERPVSVGILREALQSGVIPGDTATPSVSSAAMKSCANGCILLEFDRSLAADVLELAFQLASSGDYLAASEQKAQWSKTPHYFIARTCDAV